MSGIDKQNNFIYFTAALVTILLASAIGKSLSDHLGHYFSEIMTLITLATGYVTLNFGRRWRPFVGTVLILAVLVSILGFFYPMPELRLAYYILGLVFFTGAAVNCGRQVMSSATLGQEQMSRTNIIVGSLALYLLLGLVWASLYRITLYFSPDAFRGIESVAGVDIFPRLLYFSYVTLATLGYGDISPLNAVSKTLAYLQAVVGTFYLAIVVASLIGGIHRTIHSQDK